MADLQSRYPAAQVESILMHEVIHWLRLMPYKLAKDHARADVLRRAGLVANDVANFAKGENVCRSASTWTARCWTPPPHNAASYRAGCWRSRALISSMNTTPNIATAVIISSFYARLMGGDPP